MRGWAVYDGGFPKWDFGGGVYALYRGGSLVYVGRTGNMRSRLQAHRRRFRFDAIKIARVRETAEQRLLERKLINRLRPVSNRALVPDLNAVWWYRNR